MEKDRSMSVLIAACKGNGDENHALIYLKEGGEVFT